MYETIELSWLTKLAPFTTSTHLETVVIKTAQSNGIQVRGGECGSRRTAVHWCRHVSCAVAASDGCLVQLLHFVLKIDETSPLRLSYITPFLLPPPKVHIDHQADCLRFGSDMSFSYKNETPEGPYVQVHVCT